MILTFKSVDKILKRGYLVALSCGFVYYLQGCSVIILVSYSKLQEEIFLYFFNVVRLEIEMVLTFESVDKLLKHVYSNESKLFSYIFT